MLSFIHTADIHLDAPVYTSSLSYELRQDDFRRTMRKIRDLVWEKQADFWLIAGDLMELHGGRRATAVFLRDLFASVAPTPVCIAPGNHDPWRTDSYYQSMEWPGNVFWFTPEWGVYEFPEKSCVIYGWGFPQPHVYESPLLDFPGKLDGYRHHLMVLHASVIHSGGEEHHPYAPITLDEMARTGMDYIALGHIHKPALFPHPQHKKVFAAYPGSPEGLSVKEDGPRHVLYGELGEEGQLKLEEIPVQTRMILKREVEVQGAETMEQLVDRVEQALSDVQDGQILAVTLTGERPAHFSPAIEVLQQRFTRFFSIRFADKTRPDLDVEKLIAEGGIWGRWVKKLLEEEAAAEDEQQREVARMAVKEALDRIGGVIG
ncbi:metallophosphoesterase [Brevibacillus ruminantium]|uniref:Metallophosphoesterase n=1 Tax=Brevibacillus ruminantium TaxID=2950604 RepID=A0ABY4WI70_9BACL|nr:DNA repair exonuclease [Brevibacillus ruminantium]USG66802.1 metallophosphoesterase [Brevibacillus ruminantium]